MQPSVQTLFKPPFKFDRPVDVMLFDCGIFHFPQYVMVTGQGGVQFGL